MQTNRVSTIVKGNTYFRNDRYFNINYFDDFGIESHTKIFDKYFNRDGKYRKNISKETQKIINFFWSLDDHKQKVFFSDSINYETIEEFVSDVYGNSDNFNNKINLDIENYNGDSLTIIYNAKKDGYITFIDNWSPGWEVIVNSEQKNLELLFNSYKSVKIKKGLNQIKYIYKPW